MDRFDPIRQPISQVRIFLKLPEAPRSDTRNISAKQDPRAWMTPEALERDRAFLYINMYTQPE
jgi:hypothetical protein